MKWIAYILFLTLPIIGWAQPGVDLNNRTFTSGYIAYEDTSSVAVNVNAGDTLKLGLFPDLIERRNRPIHSDSLYNRTDSTLIGRFGCAYNAVIKITVEQGTNNNTRIGYWFNIGGGIPPLYENGLNLTRGTGAITKINKSTGIYTLDTWESNGGELYFTSDQAVTVRWNRLIVYQIHEGYGVPFTN